MDAFDQREGARLLQLWEKHIPMDVLSHDLVSQRLEFYLRIFCTVLPGRPVQYEDSDDRTSRCMVRADKCCR